jgi:chromate transporter
MSAVGLYWVFLRAILLSFSGFATVPLLRDALVLHRGVLSDAQLNDAIAISQASPGPLGMYVVAVGYFVSGLSGAFAGALALATPAPLAIPIARLLLRRESRLVQGGCAGIVVAACGLMLATGLQLAAAAAPTRLDLAAVIIAAVIIAATRIKPIWIIVAGAALGLAGALN